MLGNRKLRADDKFVFGVLVLAYIVDDSRGRTDKIGLCDNGRLAFRMNKKLCFRMQRLCLFGFFTRNARMRRTAALKRFISFSGTERATKSPRLQSGINSILSFGRAFTIFTALEEVTQTSHTVFNSDGRVDIGDYGITGIHLLDRFDLSLVHLLGHRTSGFAAY